MCEKRQWNVITAGENEIDALVMARLSYLSEDLGTLSKEHTEIIQNELPLYFLKHLNRDLFCYLIREADRLISCAFLLVVEKPLSPSFINGKTGIVFNVCTDPAYRHQGCARAVMRELISQAEAMHLCKVELQATKDGYPLYQKSGFKVNESHYISMVWKNPAYFQEDV